MAAHSSILVRRIPWIEEPGGLLSMQSQRVGHEEQVTFSRAGIYHQGSTEVKNLPAMQETRVQSLGGEDPLEKGMAAHSRILAWRIPWTEEPGGLQSMGSQRVGHN